MDKQKEKQPKTIKVKLTNGYEMNINPYKVIVLRKIEKTFAETNDYGCWEQQQSTFYLKHDNSTYKDGNKSKIYITRESYDELNKILIKLSERFRI